MGKLKLSKQWRIEQRGDQLYVLGGQDSVYTIDMEGDGKSYFDKLTHEEQFIPKQLSLSDQIVLEQLLSAGVLVPLLPTKKPKTFSLKFVGQRKLTDRLSFTDKSLKLNDKADLTILVRSNESLSNFLEKYSYIELRKPHLFLDLGYNHTVSLGPLVFPGATSCVACLEGRLKTRWGDEKPPTNPASSVNLVDLAKEWLKVELLKLLKDEDYYLVNKTVVLDAQNRSMLSNKLLTVPLCPYCNKNKLLSSGQTSYTFAKP